MGKRPGGRCCNRCDVANIDEDMMLKGKQLIIEMGKRSGGRCCNRCDVDQDGD